MSRHGRSAAILLATLLVALTPLFAYADAGPKSKLSISETDVLNQVESLMGETDFNAANHGEIVSFAAKNFQELAANLNLSGKKLSRGQLISIIARSDAGKNNTGKNDEDSEAESNASGAPTVTATATATGTTTSTPTATVDPTLVTSTPTATPEKSNRGRGNRGR